MRSVFSPDGKQIAFTWYQSLAATEVRVVTFDGKASGTSRVLFKPDQLRYASLSDWSRDGKWIAAQLYRFDGTTQLALISAADGSLRVLKTVNSAAPGAYFSPDNRYLAHTLLSDR